MVVRRDPRRAVPAAPHRGRRRGRRRSSGSTRRRSSRSARRPTSPGGPVWPGGLGVHDDGSLHVVFGNHAHRLDPDLDVLASRRRCPATGPYNSFVPLPDGHLVTKDFGGSLPGRARRRRRPRAVRAASSSSPTTLDDRGPARCCPEPSIARLSADGDDVYVVGDTSLLRVRWDGTALDARRRLRAPATARSRARPTAGTASSPPARRGSSTTATAASATTARSAATGVSTAPLHLVRVDLATGEVAMAEVCGQPGGLVANPPVVDERRRHRRRLRQRQRRAGRLRPRRRSRPRWRARPGPRQPPAALRGHRRARHRQTARRRRRPRHRHRRRAARADTGSRSSPSCSRCPGFDRDFYVCSLHHPHPHQHRLTPVPIPPPAVSSVARVETQGA